MTILLERDPVQDLVAAAHDGAPPSIGAVSRRCTVVECRTARGGLAVLYVFHRTAPAWVQAPSHASPRLPGRHWRHAVGLRAGDLLQLDDGDAVLIDKIVAAPSLDEIGECRAERVRAWRRAADGSWRESGRGAG